MAAGRSKQDALGRIDVPKRIAGDLFDDVGVGAVGRQKGNITLQPAAAGLEALDLEIEERHALGQSRLRLEAMPAVFHVMREIDGQTEAATDDQSLPDQVSTLMKGTTQDCMVLQTQEQVENERRLGPSDLKCR